MVFQDVEGGLRNVTNGLSRCLIDKGLESSIFRKEIESNSKRLKAFNRECLGFRKEKFKKGSRSGGQNKKNNHF